MATEIVRSLIGHQDFALGQGKITQVRGPHTISLQTIELEFIFRTVEEIKALNYVLYAHVALFEVGPLTIYYFDPASMVVPDDDNILLPNTLLAYQPGRYIKVVYYNTDNPPPVPVVWDTFICSLSDQKTELLVDLIDPANTFRASYALDMTDGEVKINCKDAPTGSKIIVDLHMNGVSVFDTLVSIDIGETTSKTASVPAVLNITEVPDDAEFEAFIIQIGSVFGGTGLKINVSGVKVPI